MVEPLILYLDESGPTRLPKRTEGSHDPHYCLGGVILTDTQTLQLQDDLQEILAKYFPDRRRRPRELHFGDLQHPRGLYRKLSALDRLEMTEDLLSRIRRIRPRIMGTAVHLRRFGAKEGSVPATKYALKSTLHRYNYFLREAGAYGRVYCDSIHDGSDRDLRDFAQVLRSRGARDDVDPLQEQDRLERIVDGVVFTDSHASSGIQLADCVAWILREHVDYCNDFLFGKLGGLWVPSNPLVLPLPGPREAMMLPAPFKREVGPSTSAPVAEVSRAAADRGADAPPPRAAKASVPSTGRRLARSERAHAPVAPEDNGP